MKLMGRKKTVRIVSLLIASLLFVVTAGSALAAEYDISLGSVTVAASDAGQTVTQNEVSTPDSAPVVTGTSTTSATAPANTVTVISTGSATANVEIKDLTMDLGTVGKQNSNEGHAAITVQGNANITVSGNNTLQGGNNAAGIEAGEGDSVTIDGNGKLDVTAGSGKSQGTGAAIGGAAGEAGGDITITGNVTVNAKGNGTVVDSSSGAKSAPCSAALGGGSAGAAGNITITGNATVNAVGGGTTLGANGQDNGNAKSPYSTGAAGIGAGGTGASGGTIVISGNANVTAQGGHNGAGIGTADANDETNETTIAILDNANVNATGGSFGAGIGGGVRDNGANVTVSTTGSVTANGGIGAAGFGGGGGGVNGSNGNTTGGNGGTLKVENGTVTANGGEGAPGVGGGSGAIKQTANGGSGATATVNGGTLHATGGENAVGIGSGSNTAYNKNTTVYTTQTSGNGTLHIAGGSGIIKSQTEGYQAVSAETDWTDEADYDVTDENGEYDWNAKVAPVDPTDPTDPAAPAGPAAPGAPADPAAPADQAAPEGNADETIVPASVPADGGDGIDATEMTTITPEQAPLAGAKSWALVNLLCAIMSGLASAWMFSGLFGKQEKDADTMRTHKALRLGSLAVFAASAVAFILTENMRAAMQMTDSYTLLMVVLLLGQGALAIMSAKRTVAKADAKED